MLGKSKKILISLVFIVFFGLLGYFLFGGRGTTPSVLEERDGQKSEKEQVPKEDELLSSQYIDFSKFNPVFRFSGNIPVEFEIEYIPQLKTINVYDATLPGEDIREKSQIYITRFEANKFLTLSTVKIINREEKIVRGHEAVFYEIAKRPGVPDFPQQPDWRNSRHKALDIRFTKNNPSLFYPFAVNPELLEETFNSFIDSLLFHNDKESFSQPLPRTKERVIKKPFGLYVTPQTSPVQPEFFVGYHTAIDYEIFSDEGNTDVSIFAICGGELRVARKASGYGGVAVQDCLIEDSPVTVVYGHLLLSSMERNLGSYLAPGDVIGNLAPAGEEAGGGRKHLHLGIRRGNEVDIRGYVDAESELASWLDPSSVLNSE